MANVKNNGFKLSGLEVGSYTVFQTLLGLGLLVGVFYVYLNYYHGFPGKQTLGSILGIALVIGLLLFLNGTDRWSTTSREKEKLEKIRRDTEMLEAKQKLKKLKEAQKKSRKI